MMRRPKKKQNKIVRFILSLKRKKKPDADVDKSPSDSARLATVRQRSSGAFAKRTASPIVKSSPSESPTAGLVRGVSPSSSRTEVSTVSKALEPSRYSRLESNYGLAGNYKSTYQTNETLRTELQPPAQSYASPYDSQPAYDDNDDAKSRYICPPSQYQTLRDKAPPETTQYEDPLSFKSAASRRGSSSRQEDPQKSKRQVTTRREILLPSMVSKHYEPPSSQSSVTTFDASQLIQMSSVPSAVFDYGEKKIPTKDPIQQVAAAITKLKFRKLAVKERRKNRQTITDRTERTQRRYKPEDRRTRRMALDE